MKTAYIVGGGVVVAGLAWYFMKKKNSAAPGGQTSIDPAAATGVIPLPADQATQPQILPSTLIEPSAPSGNSGIMPPAYQPTAQNTSVPVVAPPAPAKPASVFVAPTSSARQVDATHWIDIDGNKFELTNTSDKWGRLFLVNGGGQSKAVSVELDSTGHIKTKNAAGENWAYNSKTGGWKRLSGFSGLGSLGNAYALNG